jgi:alanyl aminopeptidase
VWRGGARHETSAAPVPVQSAVEKTAPAAATPVALRLPEGVRPQSYALKMHMSPKEEAFRGTVEVQIAISSATDTIHMHAGDNLVVKEAKVGAKSAKIARAGEDRITLTFDEKLGAATHKLTLVYDGKLPAREGKGAYRQEERGEHYIFTQFESTDARRAFPCFDEPGFKTPYQITMEVPAEHLAFANTPQTNEAPPRRVENGLVRAIAAASELPRRVRGRSVRDRRRAARPARRRRRSGSSCRRGARRSEVRGEQTGKVVEKLEAYFGIPYPYEKLDHIAVPQKGGAMENPGLITYGTSTILGKPEDKSVRLQRGYLGIAAHELGHIWFGDYVTTAWWDDIWLNEAFATWISAKIVDQMHPEWDGAVSRVQSKNGVMGTDSLVSTRRSASRSSRSTTSRTRSTASRTKRAAPSSACSSRSSGGELQEGRSRLPAEARARKRDRERLPVRRRQRERQAGRLRARVSRPSSINRESRSSPPSSHATRRARSSCSRSSVLAARLAGRGGADVEDPCARRIRAARAAS